MIYKGVYMKIKTGVDIIEVFRIQEAIEKHGDLFLKRIYSEEEIQRCQATGKMKYQHYAARFAAKEAVFKAISDLMDYRKEDIWRNIVIKNEKGGKPFVEFSGTLDFLNIDKAQRKTEKESKIKTKTITESKLEQEKEIEMKLENKRGIEIKSEIEARTIKNKIEIESMDLSLSHIKDYAIANFVMLINE